MNYENHRQLVWEEFEAFLGAHEGEFKLALEIGGAPTPSTEIFKKHNIEVEYCEKTDDGDVHTLDVEKRYDLIYACHSFEHWENPILALRNIKRALKDSGMLFLATPSPCYHQILGADKDHIFVMSPLQMTRLLTYIDFDFVSCYLDTKYKDVTIPKEQDYNVISTARKLQ